MQEAENDDLCSNFSFLTQANPIYFEDIIKDDKWIAAIDEETQSIKNNQIWDLVELPKGMDAIKVKWVYKTKYNNNEKVEKQKERPKGLTQQLGIDYNENFAPMERLDTIRMVLNL